MLHLAELWVQFRAMKVHFQQPLFGLFKWIKFFIYVPQSRSGQKSKPIEVLLSIK